MVPVGVEDLEVVGELLDVLVEVDYQTNFLLDVGVLVEFEEPFDDLLHDLDVRLLQLVVVRLAQALQVLRRVVHRVVQQHVPHVVRLLARLQLLERLVQEDQTVLVADLGQDHELF